MQTKRSQINLPSTAIQLSDVVNVKNLLQMIDFKVVICRFLHVYTATQVLIPSAPKKFLVKRN